jgi:hypothetical protein
MAAGAYFSRPPESAVLAFVNITNSIAVSILPVFNLSKTGLRNGE